MDSRYCHVFKNIFSNQFKLLFGQVMLHNPVETPKISNFGLLLSPGMESMITNFENFTIDVNFLTITARVRFSNIWYSATSSLKDISKEIRQCLFENETKLEFFR